MCALSSDVRLCLFYEFKLGTSAREAARKIWTAFGDDATNVQSVEECFKKFEQENGLVRIVDIRGAPITTTEIDPTTVACKVEATTCHNEDVDDPAPSLDVNAKEEPLSSYETNGLVLQREGADNPALSLDVNVKDEPLSSFETNGLLSQEGEPCSEDANFAFANCEKTCINEDAVGAEELKCEEDAEKVDSNDAKADSDPLESDSTAIIEDQPEELSNTNTIFSPERENSQMGYPCPQCDKRFKNRLLLSRHVRLAYTISGKYQCTKCNCSFSRFTYLKQHLKIHIGKQEVYCCTICKASFTRNNALKRHIKGHDGVKRYMCALCDSSFTRRENLLQHQHIHTGVKPYKCNTCNSSFRWKNDFQKHLLRHTDGYRSYSCSHCNKTYTRRQNLIRHILVHSDEKSSAVRRNV